LWVKFQTNFFFKKKNLFKSSSRLTGYYDETSN